jgi:tRNA dimethylallyltransferase
MSKVNKQLKAIVILGPTSTGKSDLAVFLAKKLNGEVISADSRQVYKGMNLGTGKVTKKEMQKVPHHMLDLVSPKSTYNASKFKKTAERAILDITRRGKLPIIAGGTGFWIDALVYDQSFPEVKPNLKLRKKLEQIPASKLFVMLKKLDPKRAKNIDPQNHRRLIRAIEIAKAKPKQVKQGRTFTLSPLFLGLDLPTERLYRKIDERLNLRLKRGMLAEVQKLKASGLSWKRLDNFGLEYRYLSRFLQGKLSKEKMKTELSFAIKHYAKRQRTWFKRNQDIIWLNPELKTSAKKAEALVRKYLKS